MKAENLDKYAMPHVTIEGVVYTLAADRAFDGGCLSCALAEKCEAGKIPGWCSKLCQMPRLFGTTYEMCWLRSGKEVKND